MLIWRLTPEGKVVQRSSAANEEEAAIDQCRESALSDGAFTYVLSKNDPPEVLVAFRARADWPRKSQADYQKILRDYRG